MAGAEERGYRGLGGEGREEIPVEGGGGRGPKDDQLGC